MNEGQITVDSLLGEHAALRAHLNIIRGLSRDWKQLLTREKTVPQGSDELKSLTEKRANLKQAMGYLEDGLKQHHAHENAIFTSLIGALLLEAINLEHTEMVKMIESINSLIINENISEFLEKGMHIMQLVDELCAYSSSHSSREDGILYFLKKAPALSSCRH